MASVFGISVFGQGLISPERIHIGDTSSFPLYSDGPVKIFAPGNTSYGVLLLKNPASNLCTAADFYNDINSRMTVGIAGSENSHFYRNCGYIFTSNQNSQEPIGGLVIGHLYESAPIIFSQNDEEVVRIDNTGNLGIGIKQPLFKLDVAGLIHTAEGIMFPDGTVQTSAASSTCWHSLYPGSIYTMGNVGIGSTSPEVPLRIEADVPDGNGRALVRLRNTSYAPTASVSYGLESNDGTTGSTFTHTSTSFTAIPDLDNYAVIATNGKGFAVYTTKPYSSIRFYTDIGANGIIERMRITGDGKVGIGTSQPKAKLEIAEGDIFISDINKGIIMKSPDERCWKGTLDSSGILNFVVVNCEDLAHSNFADNSEDMPVLSIYPNPVNNTVTIASRHYNLKNATAVIYTVEGRIVKKEKLFSDYTVLKLNNIPQGSYLIKVINKKGEEIGVEKIIKN
jgi:hypothetical protein